MIPGGGRALEEDLREELEDRVALVAVVRSFGWRVSMKIVERDF